MDALVPADSRRAATDPDEYLGDVLARSRQGHRRRLCRTPTGSLEAATEAGLGEHALHSLTNLEPEVLGEGTLPSSA